MRSIFGQFIFEHFPSDIICFLFRQHFWVLKNRNLLFCSDGDFLMLHWTHFFAKKAFDRSAWTSRTYFPKKKILWGRHSPVDSSAFREDSEWTQSTNSVECSVTKFGEISPLWQNYTSLCANFCRLIWFLAKCWGYFGKFVTLLG